MYVPEVATTGAQEEPELRLPPLKVAGSSRKIETNLVGGLEHFLFSHILGIIIPID